MFWTILATATLVLGIAASPALLLGEKASRRVAKAWSNIALFLLKTILGIDHQVEGAQNIPAQGAIIAANHQSTWETIALYNILANPVVVYKRELSSIPIFGWFLLRTGNIAIDRSAGVSALRKMQRDAAAGLARGQQFIIFPEGTRVKPGVTAEYRPGVAGIYKAADKICVPVAHDSGAYWRYPELAKQPGRITLRFLSAIEPGLPKQEFLVQLKAAIDGARPDLSGKPVDQTVGAFQNA